MSLAEIPIDGERYIRELYWNNIKRLCKLGFAELTPDGKNVRMTQLGKEYMMLEKQLKNKNGGEI